MADEQLRFGQKLGHLRTVPESIQYALGGSAVVLFVILWQLDIVSVRMAQAATVVITVAIFGIMHCVPALRSSLTIYEHGLETVVQGKSLAFAYDQLDSVAAKFTDHKLNHQCVGIRARIEFFVDGQLSPYVHQCDFRRGSHKERLISLAIDKCSQAIQRRLLAELDREGFVRWRNNIALCADGLLIVDSASDLRLIPFQEIVEWKIADNTLKIWRAKEALPCVAMGNESPNFVPLFRLFESLARVTRKIDPHCASEPPLASQA